MKKNMMVILVIVLLSMSFVSAKTLTEAAPKNYVAKNVPMKSMQRMSLNQKSPVNHCYQADESYAVYHNGLWWAWLAPVARNWQGDTPSPDLIGDGWREVKDDQEWSLRPEARTFEMLNRCAARTFFPEAPHCDWNDPYNIDSSHPDGYLTYYIDGSISEYWVVHDDCGGSSNQVPEFGSLGALVAMLGIAGIVIYRRRR